MLYLALFRASTLRLNRNNHGKSDTLDFALSISANYEPDHFFAFVSHYWGHVVFQSICYEAWSFELGDLDSSASLYQHLFFGAHFLGRFYL